MIMSFLFSVFFFPPRPRLRAQLDETAAAASGFSRHMKKRQMRKEGQTPCLVIRFAIRQRFGGVWRGKIVDGMGGGGAKATRILCQGGKGKK
jgi:hypothetical protein